MPFKRGNHICAIYSTTEELTREVARFLAEGFRNRERSWYVGSGDGMNSLRDGLQQLGIDVASETKRKALQLISGDAAYIVHGTFNPEATIQIFNDAIEQAYTDGFTGSRAATEMSWALDCTYGPHQVIVYEALRKSLFANCRAIGFCLYDRKRMPRGDQRRSLDPSDSRRAWALRHQPVLRPSDHPPHEHRSGRCTGKTRAA